VRDIAVSRTIMEKSDIELAIDVLAGKIKPPWGIVSARSETGCGSLQL
jgi:hypothetical protein